MDKKRQRTGNFSAEEEEILVGLIEKYGEIVESKKADAFAWQEKSTAWDQICEEFQILSGTDRTARNLRMKYENLKRKVKRQIAEMKKQYALTDVVIGLDGKEKISDISKRVAAILVSNATVLDNSFDNDRKINQPTIPEFDFQSVGIDSNFQSLETEEFPETTEHSLNSNKELDESSETSNKEDDTIENNSTDDWPPWVTTLFKIPIKTKLKRKIDEADTLLSRNKITTKKIKFNEKSLRKKPNTSNSKITSMLKAQEKFFINEEQRSREKHEWEKEEHLLKIDILKIEKEMKRKQLSALL